MAGWLNTPLLNLLESGLDGLGLRQKVLADNIANVDTPGFKRSDVNFEKLLQAAMEKGKKTSGAAGAAAPGIAMPAVSTGNFVEKDLSTSFRNDGNNVDIDREMTMLAENTLQYDSLIRMLTYQFQMLKQVIRE